MSSKFAKKQSFKLKKLERLINIRNVDRSFNKEEPIKNMVEVNIYYQGYRKRVEINVIRGQKWMVILEMLWLAHHNPEINWRSGEVKITKCLEEYEKQWRPVQGKLGWKRQKEEEAKEKARKRKKEKKKKKKMGKMIEVKKVVEKWEIQDKEKEAAKLKAEVRKLVPKQFHRWIKVFSKKQLERMLIRKI